MTDKLTDEIEKLMKENAELMAEVTKTNDVECPYCKRAYWLTINRPQLPGPTYYVKTENPPASRKELREALSALLSRCYALNVDVQGGSDAMVRAEKLLGQLRKGEG